MSGYVARNSSNWFTGARLEEASEFTVGSSMAACKTGLVNVWGAAVGGAPSVITSVCPDVFSVTTSKLLVSFGVVVGSAGVGRGGGGGGGGGGAALLLLP